MINTSTPNESVRSSDGYYIWKVDGCPVSVHLSLAVVDRLNSLACEGLSAMPRRGLEIGGVLLGRTESPTPGEHVVFVDQIDPLEIEHVRGPSYVLSSADKQELSRALRKQGRKKGTSVVGFYRSHTRPGLYLDEYDYDLLRGYFAHESSIALLARPVVDGTTTAGFFVWEDGEVHRASTYRDFPLKSELLRSRQSVQRPDASAPVPSPRPSSKPVETPRPVPEPEPISAQPPKASVVPVPKVMVLPTQKPRRQLPSLTMSNFGWQRVGIVAAALLLVVVLWKTPRDTAGDRAHNQLALNVEPTNSGLRLTWDRGSPLVGGGRTATIAITDGQEEKQLVLTESQLKTGSLIYWPTSGDVNFRVQIGDFSESLRAVGSRLPVSATETAQTPSPAPPVDAPQAVAPVQTRARIVTTPRAVLPDNSSTKPAPNSPVMLAPPTDVPAPQVKLERAAIPSRQATPPPAFADVEPVRSSGFKNAVGSIFGRGRDKQDFVPARAVRKVNPSVPDSLKTAGNTRVSVKVTLDASGSVRGTDLVTRSVDARLANAAMDAAKRWRFEPARQQDRAVESSLILHFNF